jgi:threonylcarbamoyladenosine tRNA methylthiotransferase MtaB
MPRSLSVSFKTVGCRLNQAETSDMEAVFRGAGYRVVPFETPATVCVIHTCAVTAKAVKDCCRLSRSIKRTSPETLVVLAGCAAQADAQTLEREAGADLLVNQQEKRDLPGHLAPHLASVQAPSASTTGTPSAPGRTRALIKVQDGCNFFCAYCIVPYARPNMHSRPVKDVVEQARQLADQGYREVVLTGANLGCYRDDTRGVIDLLKAVETVPGIERIRISSIEITTVEREVVDFMAHADKLCPYLHLPLQSGSNRILEAMGRHYTRDQYLDLVDYARTRIPRLGLGTDIICGFPGEDDRAHADTLDLVERVPFSNLHVFSYSPRAGTPAAEQANQVDTSTRKQRSAQLIELGAGKKQAFAERLVGEPVSVLVESIREGTGKGWTGEYVQAHIQGPGLTPNTLVTLSPDRAYEGAVYGTADA